LFASLASAQALPGSVEFGAEGGRFYGGSFAKGSNRQFQHRVEVDDDILSGFWLGAQLTRKWGVEVSVRRTSTQIVEPQSGVFPNEPGLATIDIASIEARAVRVFPYGNFVPYLAGGVGTTNLDINVSDRSIRDVNRFGISLAVGAKFYAARWVGARIDFRGRATYLGRRGLGQDQGWTDTGRWFRDSEISGGVFFAFDVRHSAR
jgi:hypothetical protein